jgi:uncharacterized protein (UPF0335 family)
MTAASGNSRAADELISFRDRFTVLFLEQEDLNRRIGELVTEAKSRGYVVKAIKTLAKRKLETETERANRRDYEAQLELYAMTTGQAEAPLSDDARRRMSPPEPPADNGPDHQDDDAPLAPPSDGGLGPTEADITAAHAEGGVAFQAGAKVTDNPYPAGDPRRRAWDQGFCLSSGSDGMDIPAHLRRPERPKKPAAPPTEEPAAPEEPEVQPEPEDAE